MAGAVSRWFRRRYRLVVLACLVTAIAGLAAYTIRERRQTDRILVDGERLLASREYARAREQLERYLEVRPSDAHARLLAARAARGARAFRESREHLDRCRSDGGEAEAIDIEESLIEVSSGNPELVPSLRERTKSKDDLALVVLEVLIQYDLDTYQLGSALDGFTRYLEVRPNDLHARLGRGFVWERFLNFSDAVVDYRAAVVAHPESERARLKLAETLLIVGTPDEALKQYEWLAERGPDRPSVRLGLARCHRKLARSEEAIKLLDGLLLDFPNHGEVLWERGDLELELGRPASAEPWLRKAAEQRPFDRRVQYALYRCLLRLGQTAEAEVFNARVKQLDADLTRMNAIRNEVMKRPEDVALRCEGGLLFLRNGEREEGRRWLQLALRLDPQCEAAHRALDADLRIPTRPPN